MNRVKFESGWSPIFADKHDFYKAISHMVHSPKYLTCWKQVGVDAPAFAGPIESAVKLVWASVNVELSSTLENISSWSCVPGMRIHLNS